MDRIPGATGSSTQHARYQIVGTIAQSTRHVVWDARRVHDDVAVAIKAIAGSRSAQARQGLQREFDLLGRIDSPWVIRALDQIEEHEHVGLVLQRVRAPSLQQVFSDGPLHPAAVRQLAIKIAQALAAVHRIDLVHTALRPSNVLFDADSGAITLIDFAQAIASGARITATAGLPSEREALLYLAPEQSGRIPTTIDERTDLYALGALLYHALCAAPPFPDTDPLLLVHAHLARTPLAPHRLDPAIPPALGAIVMKLLAKAREDRYQSAQGLLHDLEHCPASGDEAQQTFRLGARDIPRQFRVPRKLFGRDGELALLMNAFERISMGATELLLVSGAAGCGKSSLVEEIQAPVLRRLGYFAVGRATRFERNTPYSALRQALRQLAHKLLAESEESVTQWRASFSAALGALAHDLTEVVPELALLLDPLPRQADVDRPEAIRAQQNVNAAVERLLQTITASSQPVVLFFDDLHWADPASLATIQRIATQPALFNVLIVGAYREAELHEGHPLTRTLTAIEQAGARPSRIVLSALEAPAIAALIREALHCAPEPAAALAEVLHARTGGNAARVLRMLRSLHDAGFIAIEHGAQHWRIDLPAIEQATGGSEDRALEPAIEEHQLALHDVAQESADAVVAPESLAVIQAAQALSSEIDLAELLRKLMRIALATAGANRGSLVLESDGRWFVEAAALSDVQDAAVLQSVPLEQAAQIAVSMVNYVRRTGEALIVDDAPADSRFAHDAYVRGSAPRSVFCVPIVSRTRLIGVLYLENHLTRAAFTARHTRLITLLSAQIAISIENARLYEAMRAEITERARAEERIREQAMLLDKANDAIVMLDLDGRIRYWNHGAEQLYGWTAVEMYGKHTREAGITAPDDDELRHRGVQTRGGWSGEVHQRTKAGVPMIAHSRATLIRDAAGAPTGTLIINTDITERKRIETHLLRAQRMQSIGTLAGGIAHDLNNVLTPVLMAVDTMKLRLREAHYVELLDMIRSNVERGAGIVSQLLTFARGVEGQRTPVDPRGVVAELERIVRETFPRSIILRVDAQAELPVVLGDPTQLHQVLLNLALNARDAMPAGGTLRIAVEHHELSDDDASRLPDARPGSFVIITVADTGSGIPQELLDKVFEPFFTTKAAGSGTGLGLASVAGIVKSHEGFVALESTPGAGTTVHVYLPAGESEQAEQIAPSTVDAPGAGELVLVVDDEPGILRAAASALEAGGYQVLTAANGEAALEQYGRRGDEVRVVLTDLMMPRMDGPTLVRALEQAGTRAKIVLAGGIPPAPTDPNAKAARYPFLRKPYSTQQLLAMVAETLHAP